MKRRIISLILVLILLVPAVQTAVADNSGLCFTATNDTLLELSSMTVFIGGSSYVPAKAFSAFGIYMNYFNSESTALLSNASKQIFFNLSTGRTYDSSDTTYYVSATFQNGQVYVPVSWMCSYFGLYYSYTSGVGYGDILRIKNGSEVLTDAAFLEAATSLMKNRYNEYYGTTDPSSPSPSTSTGGQTGSQGYGSSVTLNFIGLPSSDFLDKLDQYSAKVCFFVTADEVSESPDIIRRIYGSGHSIGIFCQSSPETECEQVSELIFEAAQTRPMLICASPAIESSASSYADENGYAYYKPVVTIPENAQYYTTITAKLKDLRGYTSFLIPITDKTQNYISSVVEYIASNKISMPPLLETLV